MSPASPQRTGLAGLSIAGWPAAPRRQGGRPRACKLAVGTFSSLQARTIGVHGRRGAHQASGRPARDAGRPTGTSWSGSCSTACVGSRWVRGWRSLHPREVPRSSAALRRLQACSQTHRPLCVQPPTARPLCRCRRRGNQAAIPPRSPRRRASQRQRFCRTCRRQVLAAAAPQRHSSNSASGSSSSSASGRHRSASARRCRAARRAARICRHSRRRQLMRCWPLDPASPTQTFSGASQGRAYFGGMLRHACVW